MCINFPYFGNTIYLIIIIIIEVIIAGDFNIDLLKRADKEVLAEYFDMFTRHSVFPKITLLTRLSNKHGTLIDNIFCKLTENTLDTTNGILINKFSDYQPYFTILNGIHHKNNVPKYIKITKKDDDSILNFHHEILIIDKLAPKTSCGFDGISTKLVKAIKTAILGPVTLIINQMLNTGIFPDKLKIAKIIPIHKKGMKLYSQTIGLSHFCLQFQKF